jgi:hypothetical protein
MAVITVEGSTRECRKWVKDCLAVFPKVKRMRIQISCCYAKVPNHVLGRTRGSVMVDRDVDPESLLLKGTADATIRRKMSKNFSIEINSILAGVTNEKMRENTVKNVLIHELMHVERSDLLELSKNYQRRKRKKVHTGLEEEAFRRYNELREIEGLPKIKNKHDLEAAISKVFEETMEHAKRTFDSSLG